MTFVTDESMPIIELAVAAEERGFESLFMPEKTHLPVSRRTPWPGGDLPETGYRLGPRSAAPTRPGFVR